jgi:hypothetical protein
MSSDKPVRVEVTYRFAIGLREGYDYIINLGDWHAYWPDLVRIGPDSRRSAPGTGRGSRFACSAGRPR